MNYIELVLGFMFTEKFHIKATPDRLIRVSLCHRVYGKLNIDEVFKRNCQIDVMRVFQSYNTEVKGFPKQNR